MTYTVLYEDKNTNTMGWRTFISERHDVSYAWFEFSKKYASPSQYPIAIMPGNVVIYTESTISKQPATNETS